MKLGPRKTLFAARLQRVYGSIFANTLVAPSGAATDIKSASRQLTGIARVIARTERGILARHERAAESLELEWRHTWPDRPEDYVGRLNGQCVCRVYFSCGNTFRSDEWYWTCNGSYKGRGGSASGYAPSKNQAARLAEAAWFAMVAAVDRSGH